MPPPHLAAPGWRREPYRLLFPLGAALAVAAVLPFPLRGAGGGALGLFHSVAQIEGFLTTFAVGFLFTFLPRRTETSAPDAVEMIAALALPAGAVLCAWVGENALAHGLWLGLVVVVLGFAAPRLGRALARGRVPAVLVWVPVALVAGAAGALLVAGSSLAGASWGPRLWAIGRGLLTQGFVAGLVLGMGGVLLPQLTREAPPGGRADGSQPGRMLWHALGAAAFYGSFPLEVLVEQRAGVALRALVATLVLVLAARIDRPPSAPGLHRRLAWLAAWLVPAGFWLAALLPRLRTAALHVVFVGGFAQLALAVAAHVVLSHGGRPERLAGSPAALRAMAALLALAFAGRILAGLDLARIPEWLGVAGAAFAGAVLAWAALVAPALRGRG
ncbi:MAG TPA: NnrS family protein [Anaeromyxobacteraceae bacterium]|nr:NnrS family protein [Anaeromyxobacteraceae bacterium]